MIDHRDYSTFVNFNNIISAGDPVTENQARFIIRLLKKYRLCWTKLPHDITEVVENPKWKQEFRKIDLTKEIFVEVDADNVPWICLKFPYALKETFEKEVLAVSEGFIGFFSDTNYWDKERKVRRLLLYSYNLLQINDFVQKHEFKIDETFIEALNCVDEIWQDEENISKRSVILKNQISLVNASDEVIDFFQKNQKNLQTDLLLAKSMGYFLDKVPENTIEKMCSSEETWFWYKDLKKLTEILSGIDGKVVFLLDRASDFKDWLKKFSENLKQLDLDIETRVCFRQNSKEDADFNKWIAQNNYGGKVDEGKFLIFLQKPNKWLFNQLQDVKIVVTNSVYPPNDQIAMYFLQSHPCVIFVGDVKPTDPKGKKIVSL